MTSDVCLAVSTEAGMAFPHLLGVGWGVEGLTEMLSLEVETQHNGMT